MNIRVGWTRSMCGWGSKCISSCQVVPCRSVDVYWPAS